MHARPTEPAARAVIRAAIVAVALATPIVPTGVVAAPQAAPPSPEALRLVAARMALSSLSLPDRAGQLVTTSVPGVELDARSQATLRVLRPGGVIVFEDNYRSEPQLVRWTRAVQVATLAGDATRPRALLSIDQEGGVVRRIPDAPPTRSHPQLGTADRVASTRLQGRATAAILGRVGIGLNLAPVADLDLPPRRVMRSRSFGGSPALVGRHVAAFVAGIHDGGGAAAVKHFPGFGGASVNSDDALARVTRTRAQLELDVAPFRRAVANRADAVMMSHGVYTALDRRHPASTSPRAYGLLRRELGFAGLAITDSLHARGFRDASRLGIADGCAASIAAGADIALLTGPLSDAVACRARIIAAVRAGIISRRRLDEAALRVLLLKARLGLLPGVSPRGSVG